MPSTATFTASRYYLIGSIFLAETLVTLRGLFMKIDVSREE